MYSLHYHTTITSNVNQFNVLTQLNVSRHLAMFLDCSFIKKYYFEIISSFCINAINLDDKTVFITQ